MGTMATMDKNALIVEIGKLIVADVKVSSAHWDGFALVAWYGDGVSKLNGFRYADERPGQPATPASPEIQQRLDELRDVTTVDGEASWNACVIRLRHDTGKAIVEFAYDDADAWHVTPSTATDIAARAKP